MSNAFDLVNADDVSSNRIKKMVDGSGGGGDGGVEGYLLRMINLSDEGVFHDPNCPVCCSTARHRAEKEWADSRNADTVRQIFKDNSDKFSVPVIKHHMENHYGASGNELRKREYIHKLSLLNSSGTSTMQKLEMTITALNERLIAINAFEDPEMAIGTVEKIKADATCKLTSTLEKLLRFRADMLGEMHKHGEVFTISKAAYVELFGSILGECRTESEKTWVNLVFNRISAICKEY